VTNTLGTQSAITTGISLLHTQSFNQIRDLLKSAREKQKEEQKTINEMEDAILEENDLL